MYKFNILLFLAVFLGVIYRSVVEVCHQFCPELQAAAVSEL
jgi:hypothetical protein